MIYSPVVHTLSDHLVLELHEPPTPTLDTRTRTEPNLPEDLLGSVCWWMGDLAGYVYPVMVGLA